MKRSFGAPPPAGVPADLPTSSSKPCAPDPPPGGTELLQRRRCRRPPSLSGRKLGWGVGVGGRRSGPTTPLLRWKFHETELSEKPSARPGHKTRGRAGGAIRGGCAGSGPTAQFSSRKLAAGIWQCQPPEFSITLKSVSGKPFHEHLQPPYTCKEKGMAHEFPNDGFRSPASAHSLSNGALSKIRHAIALPNSGMERATKWDPGSSRVPDEVLHLYGRMKLCEDQREKTASFASSIQAELERARRRVKDLEAERELSKKKLDHFLKKLAEEKASWRQREHEKVRALIDDIKTELKRERKSVQRMEIVNSKLVNELAETKLSAKRYLQDYEKERKARELMEEVCDELAKEIGEDKAEVEALKKESLKIRDEVEEERKLLQMAEVWREERVQMKLIDAKLALEEKYSLLCHLQANLEAFLHERSSSRSDDADVKKAELLTNALSSVRVHDIKEFVYQPPPPSEDIFSVFEELQQCEEPREREIEQCCGSSPASHASKIHTVSPEINETGEKPVRYANGFTGRNKNMEDESDWETDSPEEGHGSSNSPGGSEPSVNGICKSNASVSGTDWEENAKNSRANSDISEVCSETTRQSRKKASSVSRLWRSDNAGNCKVISDKAMNGRLPNGEVSNGNLSPGVRSAGADQSPGSGGRLSSPNLVNPHIIRGTKGCIEWSGVTQRQSLKAKLLEARIHKQKIQLRHVLKQKI